MEAIGKELVARVGDRNVAERPRELVKEEDMNVEEIGKELVTRLVERNVEERDGKMVAMEEDRNVEENGIELVASEEDRNVEENGIELVAREDDRNVEERGRELVAREEDRNVEGAGGCTVSVSRNCISNGTGIGWERGPFCLRLRTQGSCGENRDCKITAPGGGTRDTGSQTRQESVRETRGAEGERVPFSGSLERTWCSPERTRSREERWGREGDRGDTSWRRETRAEGDRSRGGGREGNRNSASRRVENGPQGAGGAPGHTRGRMSTVRTLKIRERDSCSRREWLPASPSSGTPSSCHFDTSTHLGALRDPSLNTYRTELSLLIGTDIITFLTSRVSLGSSPWEKYSGLIRKEKRRPCTAHKSGNLSSEVYIPECAPSNGVNAINSIRKVAAFLMPGV